MRKLLCFLATAAALLGAGSARADVGPPVQIHILGEPRAAQPGVPFEGQLEIKSEIAVELGNFQFAGDTWRQVDLKADPYVAMDKGRPLVIDFSVVTSDPDQWLDFTYEVDGQSFTRQFNLSPAHIAGLLGPGATTEVTPQGKVEALTDRTRIAPEPLPSGGTGEPAPSDPDKWRYVRVHGRFVYQRGDGATIGADAMTVRVYDDNAPFDPVDLGALQTDAQGYYDGNIVWLGSLFDSEPDVYLVFQAENGRVSVTDPGFDALPYSWRTGTSWNFTGTDLDFGWLQPADINQHPAVHLMTNLTRTWRWWNWYGYDTPFVSGNWPNGTTGAFYNGEIFVSMGEEWNENVACHEYGHHWVANYALSPDPVYCNGICDSPTGCGHCLWCQETANVSFTEGFPDWMGDVIPGNFAASYGTPALAVYDMENLHSCGGSFDNPLITEGFLAAVVRDIGDGTNDTHGVYSETDELSLDWGPAITCVDLDAPTTAADFLTAFKNRYPAYREGLWATAKNCGYEIDLYEPEFVTGLYSTSHSTSGGSSDPTIDMAWTRAVDDASGIRGYGISLASSVSMPEAVMDIGDVTTYTTSALPPGTYYFIIRTLDRSGKWATTAAWNGPYTINPPGGANLATYLFSGWDNVLVPRPTNDANFNSVPAPAYLDGNSNSTYWNVGLWNAGESYTGAGFEIRCYVDSDFHWWVWSGELGPYWGQYGINLGPLYVRGGRHTFETRLDATELIAETNEADNRWAHQWVWTPQDLAVETPLVRWAPPLKTAGWEAVTDGSTLYYNSDGLSMTGASWWNATVLRPLDSSADQDLYLHSPSSGATNGFASTLAYSSMGTGRLDAVIVNHNTMGWASSQDVGVINYNGHGSNYEVVHAANSYFAFGDSVTVPFAQDQMLRLWEFYVAPENVGPVSFTLDVGSYGGSVTGFWLDNNYQVGGLSNFNSFSTDINGRGRLDVQITEAGYNALVVYRNPNWASGNSPINVTIEIQKTPPDFVPLFAAGWYAPLVPRPAFDGTVGYTPAPASLPGNVASTFMNVAAHNESPTDWPAALFCQIHVDGVFRASIFWTWFGAYANGLFNWDYPWTIRGGRHMLAWKLDNDNAIEEIHEDNNIYGEQWVWSPLELALETPVLRSGPPDAYGGWADLSTGEPYYPNCDGLRLPDAGGYWRAVAVMPGPGSDVDLRLHNPSYGAKDGFADNLAGSYWAGGKSDYVLVNFNLAGGYQPYDVGAVRFSGGENFTTEATTTYSWISFPEGTYGPYSLPANRILNLVEVYLPAGPKQVVLSNLSGSVDWGLTLHRADMAYQGKSDVVGMVSEGYGQGQNERLVVDVPADGYYCLAVWKNSSADLALDGTYNLVIGPVGATPVGEDLPLPRVTALVDIVPNPFNPQTSITFDLVRDGQVNLEIFDLQGRLIRTLVNGSLSVGRHVEVWNGKDESGAPTASGIYLARLRAGEVVQMKKMTLLK